MLPCLYGYLIPAHGRLHGSSQLLTSYGNQEASLGAGVLDRRSHKPVDKLFQNHLARECLRDCDHRREVELFDRRFDRARWTQCARVLPQLRMELIELPHLAVGSPARIAVTRLVQIDIGKIFEAARCVKAGSQLVGEGLVVDKAVCACRRDGALVELHGIERASLDAGYLGDDQRCTILEIPRTICREGSKLP